MAWNTGTVVEEPNVVPAESHVIEIGHVTPPDADCPIGMDLLGSIDGVCLAGKIVSTTWPDDSQTYIAVFADGSRFTMTADEALVLHARFVYTRGTRPIRVVIEDRGYKLDEFAPNEDDLLEIWGRGDVAPCLFVWYRDIEARSPVSLSVAKEFPRGTRIGMCFGKHRIRGVLVFLVAFDDGTVEGMTAAELIGAALRFYHGGYVPIRVVL